MMKKSGTYTDTMTISQVFASMADNTSITFVADNGSAIGNELGLDQSYQGVSVLVVRSTTWRGFAIASMGTAPIWIAGSSGANQLQWKQYAQKDDLGKAIATSDLFADYPVPTFVYWGANTANTPHKAGLTSAAEGFAICVGSIKNYFSVYAWEKAGKGIYAYSVVQGNAAGWSQYASKDDLKDNAPDFTAAETLLSWANAATRNSTKFIKSGVYPSDSPNTSGEWVVEVIITQYRRLVRATQYNTSSPPPIYYRCVFNAKWQTEWILK